MENNEQEAPIDCAVCLISIDTDDVITADYGDPLCENCAVICERCDIVGSINDEFHTVDNNNWCGSCTGNNAYWCEYCEEYNSRGTSYIVDRRESWCIDCTSNAYYCDLCDEYNADGCDNCIDNCDDDGNRIIHDYSYRPDAIFHSTDKNERLFFGIEIEVESGRTYTVQESAAFAHGLEALDLAYLKSDGSLDDGFEIVTHPMSHDFFKNEATELWDTLEKLRSWYKVKAWDTRTCGLHIHISRTGFTNGVHMHNFLNLIYSNQTFYETMAGRSSSQWAKFDDVEIRNYDRRNDGTPIRDEYDNLVIKTTRSFKNKLQSFHGDRYSAVNTNNRETLEIRIFRGSVNGETIKSQIDLAHASVEYTRTLNSNAVIAGALLVENFITYIELNQELYPELCTRIAKLIPSVGLTRQNVSI